MRNYITLLLAILLSALAITGVAETKVIKAKPAVTKTVTRLTAPPVYRLDDPVPTTPARPPENDTHRRSPLDIPLGSIYVVGTTWYEPQHNGTAGKMIAVDNDGFAHFVWTNGLNSAFNPRYVYYNVWDPVSQLMLFSSGIQVNNTSRAGFVAQAVTPGGFAFPAFHETISGVTGTHSSVTMDFQARTGAFTPFRPAYYYLNGVPMDLIWPRIAVSHDSVLHMVSTYSNPSIGGPQQIAYSRGIPQWDDNGNGLSINWQAVGPNGSGFVFMDTVYTIAADVACSRSSNRLALVYTHQRPGGNSAQRNNDIFIRLSEDGGVNWGQPTNVTQFTQYDVQRAYTDVSVLFDQADVLHVAFTTLYFTESPSYSNYRARIWHWDESSQVFSIMVNDWTEYTHAPGVWNVNVQRPSLSLDPVTGYLYSSFQKFDQNWYSTAGYPNADAWVTVSTDNGRNWSVGRNVTDTHPAVNPAPAGQSQSERDITLADPVTYEGGEGILNLEWILDLDAGANTQNEGTATLNNVYYQRINVNEIPLSPLVPPEPFHTSVGRCCYEWSGNVYCAINSHSECDGISGEWDSTLTCETPCPIPTQGRCCYAYDNVDGPYCITTDAAYCISLGGAWDSTLTCSNPCPGPTQGRCCYGDVSQPACQMTSLATCSNNLYGDWDSTLTCAANPCQPFQCTCQSQPNTHCNTASGPIPDNQTVDFVITVPVQYHITDVNVCINLTHTWDADLILNLISPVGTTVLLANREGSSGDNYLCTTFDDEATRLLSQGSAPFTGSFRPEGSLSAFDGQNAFGNWVLRITDAAAQDVGTLLWVCLTFTYDQILPVELAAFDVVPESGGIRVNFRTASETNTDRFEILRGVSENGDFSKIASVASQGYNASGHSYSILDENVATGQMYWYYLVDVDLNGHPSLHRDLMRQAMVSESPLPTEYAIAAYPNPFNPSTAIRFSLKEAGDVTLDVFNVNGQWLKTLVRRHYPCGTYSVTFDASELPSGIYFAKLNAGACVKTQKLVLMR